MLHLHRTKRIGAQDHLRNRICIATNLVSRAIDFDAQERRGTVRLTQSKNVLAAVAYVVPSDRIARRHIGGFRYR